MEEVYDLRQYSHLVILHLQKTKAEFMCYSITSKKFDSLSGSGEKDTCITYDKQKMKIKSWGDDDFKSDEEDDIRIDTFRDKLYELYKKDKDRWNQDDLFLLKAVSTFMRLLVEKLIEESEGKLKGIDELFYIYVVPSEWEEKIRETSLRPIFVQSNLISKNDHRDRLLFCSDVETIFYDLMDENAFDFEKRRKTILCRFIPLSESEILIKLDLVSIVNYLFDFPGSILYPKVERSSSLSLTIDYFTEGIRAVIKNKLPFAIQEEIIQIIMDTTYYHPSEDPRIRNKNYDLKKPLIIDTSKWKLDEHQKDFMGSICIFDICSQICKNTTNNDIDDLLSSVIIKEYNILSRVDSLGELTNINLLNWSDYLLTYNRTYSRKENIKYKSNSYLKEINSYNTIWGALRYGRDVINNADIYARPRILQIKNPSTSSSIFRESKPDAIININISMESTILSYSLLDENGFTKEMGSHKDFLIDKSLCSLGSFFSFSETTTLNVKYSFIEFTKDYLMKDVSFFSGDENNALLQLNATKIETILCKNSYTEDLLVSTQQQIYIKAFLLLYMTYIKYVVSSKLSDIVDPSIEIKIGYNITIEKILLNHLFGTKEGLKDIAYASGLIQRDDDSKKLRIITEGERILNLIQQSLDLPFPLKSFFVLAQLHENYIQLTLNQVVIEFSSHEEDQEAIIISDKIIRIPNVYTSLCLNMWDSIVENSSLIQLCDRHQKYSDSDLFEIFSLENQAEFVGNLKQYISKDNLDNNPSQLATDEIIIQLGVSCNCRVYLTVRDIIDISFRPVLKDIASLVSASFVNKKLFGKFWNIQYLFLSIYFHYNPRLHDSIIKMLKETTEDVIIEQGINISHFVVPRSLNQLFQPVLYQRPISYKEFQVGTLHHVYGDRYGLGFKSYPSDVQLIYKSKATDKKIISVNKETMFLLFKKGDIINDLPTNLTFYLNWQRKSDELQLCTKYCKLKIPCDLNSDGAACFDDVQETIFGYNFNDLPEKLKMGRCIPIVISILYEAYSGSLTLVVKLAGEDISITKVTRLGAPMHLSRF